MTTRIRLRRMGAKKRPFFRVVVADQRSPRDGRFIENIGKYHPLEAPSLIDIDGARALDWLRQGAQGGVVKELREYIARELVENPDAGEVNEVHHDRGVLLQLTVDPEDMGKVIGKGGRTARAIRQVVKAAAIREGVHAAVEIVDQG